MHLTAATSENEAKNVPTSIKFTGKKVSRIFGGEAAKWNDAELVETKTRRWQNAPM